jgi:hypothetical protein
VIGEAAIGDVFDRPGERRASADGVIGLEAGADVWRAATSSASEQPVARLRHRAPVILEQRDRRSTGRRAVTYLDGEVEGAWLRRERGGGRAARGVRSRRRARHRRVARGDAADPGRHLSVRAPTPTRSSGSRSPPRRATRTATRTRNGGGSWCGRRGASRICACGTPPALGLVEAATLRSCLPVVAPARRTRGRPLSCSRRAAQAVRRSHRRRRHRRGAGVRAPRSAARRARRGSWRAGAPQRPRRSRRAGAAPR